MYLDVEYEPYQCYNASVFKNPDTGTYLYRSKFGNWVVGELQRNNPKKCQSQMIINQSIVDVTI